MSEFRYTAKKQDGQKQNGTITADSQSDAVKKLKEDNLIVLNISAQTVRADSKARFRLFGGVADKDKIIFTQQLSIMTKAGLPISQALNSLADETPNKAFAKIITSIAHDVEGGTPLSTAFAKFPEAFNAVYISVLKAGEKSGKVDEVLTRLAAQMEKDYDIKSKVKGALAYPAFVMVAMVIIVSLIMIFIVPQIQAVFAENNATLPLVTRIVIAVSMAIRHDYWMILIACALLYVAYHWYYRTPNGRYRIDLIKLNIPVFGQLTRKASIARFARIFSTLLASGIPMLEIFDTAKDVAGNEIFRQEIDATSKDVENGLEISAALKKQPHIPKIMVQLTAVGEKSGNIDEVYDNMANFMEKEVDNLTRNLTTLLEPALMLIMGGVIGTIVIAILLPIYSLTSSIT